MHACNELFICIRRWYRKGNHSRTIACGLWFFGSKKKLFRIEYSVKWWDLDQQRSMLQCQIFMKTRLILLWVIWLMTTLDIRDAKLVYFSNWIIKKPIERQKSWDETSVWATLIYLLRLNLTGYYVYYFIRRFAAKKKKQHQFNITNFTDGD